MNQRGGAWPGTSQRTAKRTSIKPNHSCFYDWNERAVKKFTILADKYEAKAGQPELPAFASDRLYFSPKQLA